MWNYMRTQIARASVRRLLPARTMSESLVVLANSNTTACAAKSGSRYLTAKIILTTVLNVA